MSESAGRLPLPHRGPGVARLSNDDSLARRAAQGDERAFAAIYKRHHQELYRYCRAILRDPDDAQDALQATMVKALRALPGEAREIALKPWLFRIAHNEAISIVRARRPAAPIDAEAADPLAAPEQEAAARERLRELVADLDTLPERQRGSLVMRELSGLSFDEIGRVFGFSPAAAKQAVYEARIALQEIAEGREMECDLVRQAISEQDGRVLRGRRIRAHLRGCERCTNFQSAIGVRRADLAALAPPLAAPAAIATLQAALGGSAAGGGAAVGAGAIGAGLGGGVALKTAAAILATAAIAGGAAQLTGVVDVGSSPKQGDIPEAHQTPTGNADPAAEEASRAGSASNGSHGATGDANASAGRHAGPGGRGHDTSPGGHGHGQGAAPGQTATHGNSGSAPGQAGSAAGQSGSAGSSAAAPGQTGSTPGQSGTAGNSSSAPGQTGSVSGQSNSSGASASSSAGQGAGSNASASTSGQAHGGGTGTAPGQTETTPERSDTAGNSADAPGHQK